MIDPKDLLRAMEMLIERKSVATVHEGTVKVVNNSGVHVQVDGSNTAVVVDVVRSVQAGVGDRAILVNIPRTKRWVMIGVITPLDDEMRSQLLE